MRADALAEKWQVFAHGPIELDDFNLPPASRELQNLCMAYGDACLLAREDPVGVKNIAPLEYSAGMSISITHADITNVSTHSHLGSLSSALLNERRGFWPEVWIDGELATADFPHKAVILGAHHGVLNANLSADTLENLIMGDAPSGLVKHMMCGAHNAFQKNIPSAEEQDGFSGWSEHCASTYFPKLLHKLFSTDKLEATLSGIAECTRKRYE